ncbi:isochorismatase family protein [Paenibacillus sp. IB182496]|uniref:Isochorismatase family protein n=1 Tax=Paenibacillus sabuli TaxID=2772509 RepID=A0A927BPB7_9BACL|nr:isochorismatase family protein [Paenibacillus sabuli]MBD2843787.1 isochorismatase family protein [Paenibacillus sabuli]
MGQGWESYIDAADRTIYARSGLGGQTGFGARAALLIIDVQYGFTGEPDGQEASAGEQPNPKIAVDAGGIDHPIQCGQESWQAVREIGRLLASCRQLGLPVMYTYMEGEAPGMNRNVGVKGALYDHPTLQRGARGTQIVEPLAPLPGERLLSKKKPSAFFGTPLIAYLTETGVDTVVVVGCTTSGCVRATVVDAFSHNLRVIVPEEAVFDRGKASHAVNLFDMQQKYAEVLPVADVLETLDRMLTTREGQA